MKKMGCFAQQPPPTRLLCASLGPKTPASRTLSVDVGTKTPTRHAFGVMSGTKSAERHPFWAARDPVEFGTRRKKGRTPHFLRRAPPF